jgi:hypothetical protein
VSRQSALNEPAHLALLRAAPEQDFRAIPELERWARGVPAAELPEARNLWESWLGSPARSEALLRLSIQIGQELEPAERYELYARAADAVHDRACRTALAANAASSAVRLGDLGGARRWLEECRVVPDLVADSAHRIAVAMFAVSEGRCAEAVELLGVRDGELPILRSYRALALAIRSHALALAGDAAGAAREMDELVRAAGTESARSIVGKLPASWSVDSSRLDVPWRRTEMSSGAWRIGFGVAVAAVALAHAVAANASLADGGEGGDAWFVLLAGAPFLLLVSAWLVSTGLRQRRIARDGIAGDGRVIGKSRRPYGSIRRTPYALGIEASLRAPDGHKHEVTGLSTSDFGSAEADAQLGKTLRVLWHPRHPRVFILRRMVR